MPDTITTDQSPEGSTVTKLNKVISEAERLIIERTEASVEIDAEHRGTAAGANWGDEFTCLEKALADVRGVAQILIEIGASGALIEAESIAYLGHHLLEHQEEASGAFHVLFALRYVEKTRASQA